jgi:AraC-like DNA-binding protein
MAKKQNSESTWLDGVRLASKLTHPQFGHHQVPPTWQINDLVLEEHLLWLIEKNACEGSLDGKPVVLEAGTLLWLQPGVRFSFRLLDTKKPMSLYRFRVDPRSKPTLLKAPQPIRILRKAWALQPHIAAIVRELQSHLPLKETRARGYMLVFFATLFELLRSPDSARQLSATQCEKLREFVAQRAPLWPTPKHLAEELGLTLDYFTRVFRHTFGVAPREWLVRERIRHATQRLSESPVKIGELAEELGYPDIYSFSRQFKKVTGHSPRAHRNPSP